MPDRYHSVEGTAELVVRARVVKAVQAGWHMAAPMLFTYQTQETEAYEVGRIVRQCHHTLGCQKQDKRHACFGKAVVVLFVAGYSAGRRETLQLQLSS